MTTKYYKCSLLSDVIINQSMATTDNVASLNYIPGSVFLGIVAKEIYGETNGKDYDIFHSAKVKFGDATISNNEHISYHYPFCLYADKLNADGDKYLHHLLIAGNDNYPTDNMGNKIQLKQLRDGYFNIENNEDLKVEKRFTIKSARDRDTRNSKEGLMFGYQSIKKGQTFVFPISYNSNELIEIVEKALLGDKRIGKSKTAEYSLVNIEEIKTEHSHHCINNENYTLVYANSHLCFFDNNGQPTMQPTAEDLNLKGEINWLKSQIRSYEYTSWNGKRNTPNAQRFCVARGSVFYIKGSNKGKSDFVGEYQTEGLGNILVNPKFLFEIKDDNIWDINLSKSDNEIGKTEKIEIKSDLAKFLHKKQESRDDELDLSKEVVESVEECKNKFKKVTSSQWGGIRSYAANAKDKDELYDILFKEDKGYLTYGVAFERYWNINGNLQRLKKLFDSKSCAFVAKFAAEMAKETQKNNNNDK